MIIFNTLAIELSRACMNKCKYCYNAEEKINNLSTQDIYQGLNIFLKQTNEKNVYISLLGGEPLIRINQYIEAEEKIKQEKQEKILHHTINTNGLLLDSFMIQKIKKLNPHLALSLDGPKIIHDFNRITKKNTGTYDQLIKLLPEILENFPDTLCQATFTPETINYLSDSYFLAKELNFNEWYWAPDLYTSIWQEKHFKILEEQLKIIALDYKKNKQIIYKPFEKNNEEYNKGNLRFCNNSKVLLLQSDKKFKISRVNATKVPTDLDQYWYIGTIKEGLNLERILQWEQMFNLNADKFYYAYNMKNICEKCLAKNICFNSSHNDKTSYEYKIQCFQPRMQCEQKKTIMTAKNLYL